MKPSELIALKAQREEAVHAAAKAADEQQRRDLAAFTRRVQDELGLTEADGWRYEIVADFVVLTHPDLDGQANFRLQGNHIMLDQVGYRVPITQANIQVLLEVLTPRPPPLTPAVGADRVSAQKAAAKPERKRKP